MSRTGSRRSSRKHIRKQESVRLTENSPQDLHVNWIPYALLILLILAVCLFFQDFGITWDESVHSYHGKSIINYYASFFEDKTALSSGKHLHLYGGLFDVVAALATLISPWGEYETRHLLNALVGVLGVVGTWKLAKLLAGCRAALLSALFLVFTPSYLGHMFNNPKDIPFAVGYIWSLYYILRSFGHFPKIPLGLAAKLGVALGLTLGVRVGALILVAYFCLAAFGYVVFPRLFGESAGGETKAHQRIKELLKSSAKIVLVAYPVMLLFWPWAQLNPLTHPFKALAYMSRFQWSGIVLLRGEYVRAKDLPLSYLPNYFLVKMPESILIALGLAVITAAFLLVAKKPRESALETVRYAFLGLAVLLPFLYVIALKSVLYDGLRHFLFVIPALCIVCGVTLDHLAKKIGQKGFLAGIAANILLVLAFVPQTISIIRLHPYEYVYYNGFIGGVRGAEGRYEMDYWGVSYKEAVGLLLDQLKIGERLASPGREYSVFSRPTTPAAYYFPETLKPAYKFDRADFLIIITRFNWHRKTPGAKIAAVKRMDVELSVVKDLRKSTSVPLQRAR